MGKGFFESDDEYEDRMARESDERVIEEHTGQSPHKGFFESDEDYADRISVEASEHVVEASTGREPSKGWFETYGEYRDRVIRESHERIIADARGDAPSRRWFESEESYETRIRKEANEQEIERLSGRAPKKSFLENDHDYRSRISHQARELRANTDDRESSSFSGGGVSTSGSGGYGVVGAALLFVGIAAFVIHVAEIPPRAPQPPIHEISLVEAKRVIPQQIRRIYRALDEGNPASLTGQVVPQLLNQSLQFDQICRPYSYRGHYVERIVERSNGIFEARVHALFQPVEEQEDTFTFAVYDGALALQSVQNLPPDWIAEQRQMAIEVARQFIYASSAGKQDLVSEIISSHLDVSPLFSESDYLTRLADVNSIVEMAAGIEQDEGVKIGLNVTTGRRKFCGDLWHLLIDPTTRHYKVVEWEFEPIFGCYNAFGPPRRERHIDPNLAEYTLKRFGVSADAR